jgi:hypothetical protein
MAARVANAFMRNFPVISVQAFEGTLTRYTTAVSVNGGTLEGAAVYQYPVVKGGLVVLKDHTDKGVILVENVAVDGEVVSGMVVSEPQGIDNSTVSGATPALGLRRIVDVAFFGLGVIELTVSATGAVSPGDIVGMDANEINEVETQVDFTAIATGDQGKLQALTYAAAGEKVAILVGASCFVGN